MGYRVDRRAVLVLTDMDGAEVSVIIGVPIRALREFDTETTLEGEWAVFLRWAQPEWNLEDADGPIPVAVESLDRLPRPVIDATVSGWRDAAMHPPAPLPPPSSDTTPSAETSPPTSSGPDA